MFCCVPSPGYNRTGWLGVKHQLTYTTALTTWSILSLSHLTVTELQNVQVTCTHHQYTHTQAVYKTTKMKYINYMYGCTLFSCKQLNDPRHRMTGSETDIFLIQWKMMHIPLTLIISLYNFILVVVHDLESRMPRAITTVHNIYFYCFWLFCLVLILLCFSLDNLVLINQKSVSYTHLTLPTKRFV